MEQTINANIAACMQSANHFGFTRVHNVCTGNIRDVPWGSIDWALGLGLTALLCMFVAFLVTIGVAMWRDI